ncbi:MAG: carbohydrate-binding protein [Eubacteriales bacterium]|nr:carbohydrate-binding protein [Eubacteriales bacterium]
MKKSAVLITVAVLLIALAVNVSAKYDAFAKIEVTPEVTLIDDDTTQDEGGSGQPIQYVEGYGVGYSSTNDIVYFEDVDFGADGAKAMTIFFSYGNDDDSKTALDVYIDDYKSGNPVCSYEIGFTGGWESVNAQEFKADCDIPGGVHTVYVQFTNEKSGSFTYISFDKADPPAETDAPETEAEAEAAAPVVTTAAQTADTGIITGIIALSGAALAVITKKRK